MLENMKNQLSVAQAVTGAARMEAQERATINNLVAQGVSLDEARLIAGQQYAVAQAQADSSAKNLVHSLNDQLKMLLAQQHGTEAATAAMIAYDNARRSGASVDAALDVKAATLRVETEKATIAAERLNEQSAQIAENYENAARAAADAAGGNFGAQGQSAFGGFDVPKGQQYTSTSDLGVALSFIQKQYAAQQSVYQSGGLQLANSALSSGGIDAAINSLKGLPTSGGISSFGLNYGFNVKTPYADEGSIISNLDALYQLKNSQTDDKKVQVANLKDEIAAVQALPETIARDQKIADLIQSIKNLTGSVDANTAASLNPLYSGRGALHIGYYKAAGGLDGIVSGGTPGSDSVPFNLMLMPGERLTVTPKHQVGGTATTTANDNRRTVINNITLPAAPTSGSARRSARQFAQGFGQIAAALSQ
ncbi:hypothetical protein [Bradyrhizobium diazoefficiens]|uniref:hypothetical protein n=1 Tax=Bradyrhizobium diazoefficiens TaxID=1355477 RepID=UPI00272B4A47|nr:hypothetical protein [Bradyrhizobium diazoefficiens]WLA62369.1 hypothetical protein QNN01_28305 [Bradyrhizobium diazoefficiens]